MEKTDLNFSKEQELKIVGLTNLIADYVIDHQMTMKDLDFCVEKVEELYRFDAILPLRKK